jgi:hypothetical protein
MQTAYRTNQSIWIINETQLSEERAAGSWCCGAQLRSTDGSGKRKYLLSYLESNPVPNTIHPGPLLTSLCVLNVNIMKPCQYRDTQLRALFRKIKRPPQNATFINWHELQATSYVLKNTKNLFAECVISKWRSNQLGKALFFSLPKMPYHFTVHQ